MNKTNRVLLILAFSAIFIFLGVNAMKEGMAAPKNERVYTILKKYIPYYLEQRVGGYNIVSKLNDNKEKPPASQVFLRLDQLEQQWGLKHLKLEENILLVHNNEKQILSRISLNKEEKLWVEEFFKIK